MIPFLKIRYLLIILILLITSFSIYRIYLHINRINFIKNIPNFDGLEQSNYKEKNYYFLGTIVEINNKELTVISKSETEEIEEKLIVRVSDNTPVFLMKIRDINKKNISSKNIDKIDITDLRVGDFININGDYIEENKIFTNSIITIYRI